MLPLIGNLIKPLTKSVVIPLRLTGAASATDAAIHKKMFGLSINSFIISNEETNDFIKIVKSFKGFGILTKGVIETIKNEAKEEKAGFLSNLLHTVETSFTENLLISKRLMRAVEWAISMSEGQGTIRAAQDF